MSLVILSGSSTASVLQNSDLKLDTLSDVTLSSIADNQLLQYNSSTSQWENVDPSVIVNENITGRIVATSTDIHTLTRESTTRNTGSLLLQKDIGTQTSFDDLAVALSFKLINDSSSKALFQFRADNDATLGKRMIMSEVSDDGTTTNNIATFSDSLVSVNGDIITDGSATVGGTGAPLISASGDMEISTTGNLTISATEIIMDADGGTY